MHEFSLAADMLALVVGVARENALSRVTEARADVGSISGISVDALRFAWEFLRESEELTKGAELVIKQPGGAGRCGACGYSGAVSDSFRLCPSCGAPGLRITDGEQFLVSGISGE